MAKHYHVITSLFGCMPSDNQVFSNKEEAKYYLVSIVRGLRDSDNVVQGTIKDGYFEVVEKTDALCDYVSIETCVLKECSMENDQ